MDFLVHSNGPSRHVEQIQGGSQQGTGTLESSALNVSTSLRMIEAETCNSTHSCLKLSSNQEQRRLLSAFSPCYDTLVSPDHGRGQFELRAKLNDES